MTTRLIFQDIIFIAKPFRNLKNKKKKEEGIGRKSFLKVQAFEFFTRHGSIFFHPFLWHTKRTRRKEEICIG